MILYPEQPFGVLCRSMHGIPSIMIELTRPLDGGMFATVTVRVGNLKLEPFSNQNGLH